MIPVSLAIGLISRPPLLYPGIWSHRLSLAIVCFIAMTALAPDLAATDAATRIPATDRG